MVELAAPVVSPAQRVEFEECGIIITDVLFTPEEIEPVRLECARLHREAMDRGSPSTQQRIRPFLPAVDASSPAISAFTRHAVFQNAARELIGPEVDQVWNQACLKLPDQDELTEFPFHQDSKFAKVDYRSGGFGCFLGLGPLTLENGTLLFAARAHRLQLDHRWSERASWWECAVDEFEIVPAVLQPGQMAIYHPMAPHGSPPNRSPLPREALLIAFGPPQVRLEATGELFGDQRPLLRGGVPAW